MNNWTDPLDDEISKSLKKSRMKRTKEDYHKLLDETVAYYSEDTSRRASSLRGECQYITDDGRMCAVGRCLQNPNEVDLASGSFMSTGYISESIVFDACVFKEGYEGFDKYFWRRLQSIHDSMISWKKKKGMKRAGLKLVDALKKDIDKGMFCK